MTLGPAIVACLASLLAPTQQAGKFLSPEPAPHQNFGTVALDGDWIAVGAPGADGGLGAVHLFDRVSGRPLTKLTQAAASGWSQFGAAVDVDGDRVVAGAPFAQLNSGTVSVFRATTGDELHCLDSGGQVVGGLFGAAVSIEGDLLAVGAPGDPMFPPHEGSVHLFRASTGEELRRLGSPGPATWNIPVHHFGASVDLDAGRILVGATGVGFVGAAYLFDAASGALLAEFHPPASSLPGQFGSHVALRGDRVAIADPYADAARGAVHLFDAASGALQHSLRFEPSQEGQPFGTGLALSSTRVAVGAAHSSVGAWRGAVHVFHAQTGARITTFVGTGAPISQRFGAQVAIDGDTLLVGDPQDNQAALYAGAAYTFVLP